MISYELYEPVLDWIYGDIDISNLEDIIIPLRTNLLRNKDEDDLELISCIDLSLVHVVAGIETEKEARQIIRTFLSEHPNILVTM